MAPKRARRPAAANPKRQPRLRRPAANVPPPDPWKKSKDIGLDTFSAGSFVVAQGTYWEGAAEVAGWIQGAELEGSKKYLKVSASGTRSDVLLKYLSGCRELYLRLCPEPCDSKVWRDDLFHVEKIRMIPEGDAKEGWMENLGEPPRAPDGEDMNEKLRQEAEAERLRLLGEGDRGRGDGDPKEDAKKKEKKEKKEKEKKSIRSSAGKKGLQEVYGGTGLDPDPDIRKAVIRKAKKVRKSGKKKKKKKKDSSSSSSTSTSTSSTSLAANLELFEGEIETQRIWRRTPGALAFATVAEAQQSLLTRQGIHPDASSGTVPPILLQYYRTTLQPTMTPALSREAHHWAMMLDLLFQGDICQGSRFRLPKVEVLGGLCKRSPHRCEQEAGTTSFGSAQPDNSCRDNRSRKEAIGGRKGQQVEQRTLKPRRQLLKHLRQRKERRWKEQRKEGRKAGLQRRYERKRRPPEGRQEGRLLEMGAKSRRLRGQRQVEASKTGEERLEPGGIDPALEVEDFSNSSVRELVTADTHRDVAEGPYLPKDGPGGIISLVQNFSDLMKWTWGKLMEVRGQQRWQLTTAKEMHATQGRELDIFPLPLPQESSFRSTGTFAALNDLAGHTPEPGGDDTPDFVPEVKKGLQKIIDRFDVWDMERPEVSFAKLFTTKDLDYTGEEIKLAQKLNWVAVERSLPDGVGQLPLQEFCTMGTLEYVLNFEKYLVPMEDVEVPKKPKVMVEPQSWETLCTGLVEKNICEVWPLDDVFHLRGEPILNGMFAVGKGEFQDNVETQRLIMNLTPVNSMCRNLIGDVCTLPGLSGFSSFVLEDDEVGVFSSEDIKCFFYLFSVPEQWKKYLGFNRLVPSSVVPPRFCGRDCVLVSRVLPMGFVNSVSIAQHVHRNITRMSAMKCPSPVGGESELRKDKGMSSSSTLFRVYLDNFDLVEKMDPATAHLVKGTPSEQVLQLRADYEAMGLPRHPKKAVERSLKAEVQGAMFDGEAGFAMAKPVKVWQYALLGAELLVRGQGTLKELQVVCGGFVYLAMFRRPLLCALNEVWQFMQTFVKRRVTGSLFLPLQVKAEIARFILLIPLAQMEFRSEICHQVSCSDASSLGGGICVSEGLTAYGVSASNSQVRGDVPEQHDLCQVLTIGMFDGIGALRMAADSLGLPVAGHVSIERDSHGRRVVESWFPDTTFFEDVRLFGEEQVRDLALRYSNVGLILLGAGPPCQGVSNLNVDKKGALRDERSSLFQEVPRVEALFRQAFPWAQVHRVMESVASMSEGDRRIMSKGVDGLPFKIDSYGLTLCHRPRLFWVTWELQSGPKAVVAPLPAEGWENFGVVSFLGSPESKDFLEPGWELGDEWGLPTFTTSRPRSNPGRRPAGLETCAPHEKERWLQDSYRFPPYQYRDGAGLWNKKDEWRRPSVAEREVLMGFPVGYTAACVSKTEQKKAYVDDIRLSLIGNSWQVGVIVWLLAQLCAPLGLCEPMCVDDIIEALTPGRGNKLQTLLMRPPLSRPGSIRSVSSQPLVRRLLGLISMKGEDLLLQASSESLVRYHRLRASIPAKLWKWKVVAGWQWRSSGDHINILEMRAILTSIRWWIRKRHMRSSRFLHLTDSLVCLHCLSRGRTSSRKLGRTLIRINALLLAADLHPMWGYIHTSQNPADRPSRRPFRRKWVR